MQIGHALTHVTPLLRTVRIAFLRAVEQSEALSERTAELCRPAKCKGQRVRAHNPLGAEAAALLAAVGRGEFALTGFRNRDLQGRLYSDEAADLTEKRRRSAAVRRKLRLLRSHGLIQVPRTHRYQLTTRGRAVITAILAARAANPAKLITAA